MKLTQLLENTVFELLQGTLEKEILNLNYDSRKITQNSVFVAIKGFSTDGHNFLLPAIKNGASVLVVEELKNLEDFPELTILKVKNSRQTLALLSANFYGNPAKKLTLVGITGTNGKTTTSFVIKALLEKFGVKIGLLGTTGNFIADKKFENTHTTPESLELHEFFAKMLAENVQIVVMEVSSHSLFLERVFGLDFKVAIFTNLTQDHLDFHETLENYKLAKGILFKNLSKNSFAVLNADDEVSDFYAKTTRAKVMTFSQNKNANLSVLKTKFSLEGTEFTVNFEGKIFSAKTLLPGKFNLSNVLASLLAVFSVLQKNFNEIVSGLETVKPVEGRFEIIRKNKLFAVVDYAHTPDALEKILVSLREVCKGKIVTVFGCGGDRDKTKRAKMGKIASELSDEIVVTSDNPRTENPLEIISEIKKGISKPNFYEVQDRKKAIELGVSLLKSGDVLLVAGKGHETYQIFGTQKIHFNDREVVRFFFEKV
ncbi:UDP-N-acetylmuramoyl-L-alanyl-D-glutamate--2,6-diaminopimelate ligase [bacterium]|nr:UDP-N-acetylmuramoyl-L-alanyl-D-glutamate--2,6-diaminopimelate ligase [bacterium]